MEALDAGDVPPHAIAVTFDDGYADNLRTAKPLLDQFGVPATFFLKTDLIGKTAGYWWDELADLVLSGTAAATLDLTIAGVRLQADYPAQAEPPSGLREWTVASGELGHPRQVAYVALWSAIQSMDGADCDAAMDALWLRLGNGEPPVALDRDKVPMDWEMVRSLAAQGGGIGAHARNHTPLNIMSANDQRQEFSVHAMIWHHRSGRCLPALPTPTVNAML